MRKLLLLLVVLLNILMLDAQKLNINGKVLNFEKKPVENATIYLLKQKDSSIINYTSSNREGNFSLKTDEVYEPSILKVDAEKLISYSRNFENIGESVSLGNIELERNSVSNIQEVKLTASPVKVKKDTIEFNASSIKVRPDSKIEELLKQIPGVQMDNDGKITINGKEVDQITINGKPFFDKNGKIALQNLPADIIKNIQFTTTKTKEEELSGKSSKSNNATINFNIDEKKNKGLISRLTLGYGSDKRYEGSGLISYFKNDTKISLLAASNNINSQGFSSDEVFDSMGRGRNSWLMQGGSVVTSGGSTYYVSGGNNTKGIQKSTTIGFNYSDKFGKEIDLDNVSLIHINNNLETRSKVSRTTLLPDYTLKTNSESNGGNDSRQYNFDVSARIRLDSLTSIYFSPSFSRNEIQNFSTANSSTFRDNDLLNTSSSYSKTDSENNAFNPNIYFSKKFRKKGREMHANMSSSINENKENQLNRSENIFYLGTQPNDNRNQFSLKKNQNSNYRFSTGYSEPITDSVTIGLNLNYNTTNMRNMRNVNDFNASSLQYSSYNDGLSNRMNQKIDEISPELSFEINKKKINGWGSVKAEFSNMNVSSRFNNQDYGLQKNFILPSYNLGMNYEFSQNKRLSLYNFSDFTIPTAEQLTPYLDIINPLAAYQGNPNLKNTWTHSTYLYFNNFNMVKNINYYLNAGFTYKNNDIINYSSFDESGRQLVTYTNISGNKHFNFGASFSKTFKWKENKLTINPRFNSMYGFSKGLINGKEFTSSYYSINPGLNFTYEIKDKLTVKPSYTLGYNFSKYKNYSIDEVNTSNQILKLELTNYLFKSRLILGNDLEYNTNTNIAPGFKRDFYFWNTSVGYSFFNKQLTAKVKVYDVLNQNQSVKRTISNTFFEDRDDLILKRYVMFSLTMKLNKFARNKTQTP
ncbi:TonB-dependent receptor [uncultured Chryseobacterium sp.]|uniref:TonB-dependent receptor n=1 Tax=uncultured Chryseobacterium sp. TaxID=259322 RepID=UPI0025DB96DF|nr:TonB-dependent receptor [uncultured Chryseobacterium sp.]